MRKVEKVRSLAVAKSMGSIGSIGLYWDYVGRMEKNMETIIVGYIGILLGYILGLYRDNGKENGNYYNGLYRDYIRVYIGVI